MKVPVARSAAPQQHKVESFHLYVVVEGKPVAVGQAPEIAQLFPNRRNKEQLADLATSILANGQDGEVLLLRDSGHLIILNGHDVCRAIAVLQADGHAIELAYRLYEPKGTTPQEVLRECMALVIRQKLSQQTCPLNEQRKSHAIIQYLQVCYSQGHFPSDRWVAEDVGCSHTWVREVREDAVEQAQLPVADHYTTKDGRVYAIRSPLAEVGDIPLDEEVPPILTESQEEEKRKEKEEREAELGRAVASSPEGKAAAEPKPEVKHEDEPLPPPAEAKSKPDEPTPDNVLDQDVSRFAHEMAVVMDWDQARERPFGKDVCKRLWAADLLDVDPESKRVLMLADKSEIEHILVEMLSPVVRELGIPDPDRSVIAAIHSLLNPSVKKSPRKK